MFDYRKAKNGGTEKEILAYESKRKNMAKKMKSYTGHYQVDSSGKIRHQSKKSVERKGLNRY